jgi:lipopolysaccharide export system protein LptC
MGPRNHQGSHEGFSAWWAVREVDHMFSRIARYTRFVVYGKWSLLGLAVLLIASLIAWPFVTKDRSGIRISFVDSNTAGQKPSSPVMNNPEYRSTNDKGEQFKITGKTATQKTPTLVILDMVEGQMLRADGGWYSLMAERAEYQQDKKLIDLFGNVNVLDTTGTQFATEHATIEVDSSHIYGKEAVSGTGPLGNILASGFEIRDNGAHITFMRGTAPVYVKANRSKKKNDE